MTQIIISDLEANLELDRQALNGVLGGTRKSGYHGRKHRRNHRFSSKYYFKEYYREEYYSSKHYDHYNKHCYTPKFDHYYCC